MSSLSLHPGAIVVLANGETGVLYARTSASPRHRRHGRPDGWYFLPDHCTALGLVVTRQPREVSENAIVRVLGPREGRWPSPTFRLAPQERHRIEFVMKAGPGQTGDVRLSVTPGAAPGSPNGTMPTSCTVR